MVKNMRNFPVFIILMVLSLLLGGFAIPTPAYAASIITVTTTGDNVLGDGLCSLREAIINANNDLQSFPDCTAGSGTDTIIFADVLGTATIILGGTELPSITDSDGLTINGGGDISINANNLSRIFKVATGQPFTIDGLTMSDGQAPGPSTPVGGAIHNGGVLTVSNSTFTSNHSDGIGGAILNYGTINIANSTFSGNSASQAGAIHNGGDGGSVITNSTFTDNEALNNFDGKGGAIYTQEPLTITNSTFINNSAEIGGAIYDYEGSLNIANSTFSSNDAVNWGGGVFNALDGSLTIINSTFSGNTAGLYGGGVYGSESSIIPVITVQTTLTNTILADNTAGTDGINCYGPIVNGGNNIEDDTDCGWSSNDGSMSNTNPLLGGLTTNGGSTQTFALNYGSPAINTGDDTVCAAAPVNNTSQNGVTRPQGIHCDVGSFELAAEIDVVIGGTTQGTYTLGPGSSQKVDYALDNGPVKITTSDDLPLIAALRDSLLTNGSLSTYSQLMGLPNEQLSDTYWFPSYVNNSTLSGQLRFGNVGVADTTVTVTIGGVERGSYLLHPNESKKVAYDLDLGPVKVQSSGGVPIVAALRDSLLVNGSLSTYSQLMGLPEEHLSDTYWFPAFVNNSTLSGQLRFANVGVADTTVTVTIGGVERGSYLLHPNESQKVTYDLDLGPVKVQSSGGVPIVAALRDSLLTNGSLTTYSQLMGLPDELLSEDYLFPAYVNNSTLSGQLRFGNVGLADTTVTVIIGGVDRGSYLLHPSENYKVSYDLDLGPVIVKSSDGVPIVAALRDSLLVNGSLSTFSQLMGLPEELLSSTYWLPSYVNNATLSGQLRFGVP